MMSLTVAGEAGMVMSFTSEKVRSGFVATVGTARRDELAPQPYAVPPDPFAPMSTYKLNWYPAAMRGFTKLFLIAMGYA